LDCFVDETGTSSKRCLNLSNFAWILLVVSVLDVVDLEPEVDVDAAVIFVFLAGLSSHRDAD
jgi:hypothetical protein